MLPPVVLQVTAVLCPPRPETEATNVVVSPALRPIELGLALTPVTTELTVTCVVEVLEGSATLTAVTQYVPAVAAVNRPQELMVPPPLTDQVIPVFAAPLTMAENCMLLPALTEGALGVIEEIEAEVTVIIRLAVAVPVLVVNARQFPSRSQVLQI
jgi:hypothetical protein